MQVFDMISMSTRRVLPGRTRTVLECCFANYQMLGAAEIHKTTAIVVSDTYPCLPATYSTPLSKPALALRSLITITMSPHLPCCKTHPSHYHLLAQWGHNTV